MAKRKIRTRKYFFNPVKSQSTMTEPPTGTRSECLVVEKNKDKRHVILRPNDSTQSRIDSSDNLDRQIEEQETIKRTHKAKKKLKKQETIKRTHEAKKKLKKLKLQIIKKKKTLQNLNGKGKKND